MKEKQQVSTKLTIESISRSALDSYKGKNLVFDVAQLVETLDAPSALSGVVKLSDMRGLTIFCLGGILNIIRQQKYYRDYGYKSFQGFLNEYLGLNRSTANDWMAIYVNLVESEVPWNSIKHLGWTKIRLFARCLTKDNWMQWIKVAEERNAAQLRKYVAAEKQKAARLEKAKGNPFIEANLSSHEDIAKDTYESEHEIVAVDSTVESKELTPLVTPEVAVTVRKTYSFLLAVDEQETVEEALALAMVDSETDIKSFALTNICVHFLATYEPSKPGDI
jgi:hypothetical protein